MKHTLSRIPRRIAMGSITLYQRVLSPDRGILYLLGITRGTTCMFYPTCSEYSKEAIKKYGVIQGSHLAVHRIMRCRPGKTPAVDNVP